MTMTVGVYRRIVEKRIVIISPMGTADERNSSGTMTFYAL
jgi:hypothetical protein